MTIAVAAVFLGTLSQRLTGIGFALVATPFLVVAFGAGSGVVVGNLLGGTVALVAAARLAREVEWSHALQLMAGAAAGLPVGLVVAATVPVEVLQTSVGVLVLLALAVMVRPMPRRRHWPAWTRWPAAATSGILAVPVGLSGPSLAVYSAATGWDARRFAVTVQPVFAFVALSAAALKLVTGTARPPELEPWQWAVVVAAAIVGSIVGDILRRRVAPRLARVLLLSLAAAGALATTVDGLRALVG